MNINTVIITGYLATDPELRNTSSGKAVCNFRVGTDGRRVQGQDGTWSTVTEWVNGVCFGKAAESLAKNARKGKVVNFQGRLETNKWQSKSGEDHYSTKVVVDGLVGFAYNPKPSAPQQRQAETEVDDTPPQGESEGTEVQGEDIPF